MESSTPQGQSASKVTSAGASQAPTPQAPAIYDPYASYLTALRCEGPEFGDADVEDEGDQNWDDAELDGGPVGSGVEVGAAEPSRHIESPVLVAADAHFSIIDISDLDLNDSVLAEADDSGSDSGRFTPAGSVLDDGGPIASPRDPVTEGENSDRNRIRDFFADAITDPGHEFGRAFTSQPTDPLLGQDSREMANTGLEPIAPGEGGLGRSAFVTIGATASFQSLIKEIVSPDCLEALSAVGVDRLTVQCGPDYELFQSIAPHPGPQSFDIHITGFAYTDDIHREMSRCARVPGVRRTGIIITHGGSGSILEAAKVRAAPIIVANPSLMDNHQEELAEEMENRGYAIKGVSGEVHLAIRRLLDGPRPSRKAAHDGEGRERCGLEEITEELAAAVDNAEDELKTLFGMFVELIHRLVGLVWR